MELRLPLECPRGERPLVDLYLEPGVFSERCTGKLPLRVDCIRSIELERACTYMEQNYNKHICLDDICRFAGLSKSTLLRTFTKQKGVTPYCYLENIRIGRAKELLEQGIMPIDAAQQTGFSDQSHFTNYFSRFIGLSPGVYREIFCEKEHKAK